MKATRKYLATLLVTGGLFLASAIPAAADGDLGCGNAGGHPNEHAANGMAHCSAHWTLASAGVVHTDAVTAPVQIGGIWYLPLDGQAQAGASDLPILGTIVTSAVTAPVLIGGIWYLPADEQQIAADAPTFLGTVETNAVTAPIEIGGILYVPASDESRDASSTETVFLGTVATTAVTAPIQIGGILYIPLA